MVTVSASMSGLTTVTLLLIYTGLPSLPGSTTSLVLFDDGKSVLRSVGTVCIDRPP